MKTFSLFLTFVFLFAVRLPAAPNDTSAKKPFTFEQMMALKRLAEPVPSPDGQWVVFAATDVDLAANTKKSHLWDRAGRGRGGAPSE